VSESDGFAPHRADPLTETPPDSRENVVLNVMFGESFECQRHSKRADIPLSLQPVGLRTRFPAVERVPRDSQCLVWIDRDWSYEYDTVESP
jgi:hypothetical protein